jgi:hypothetical protein
MDGYSDDMEHTKIKMKYTCYNHYYESCSLQMLKDFSNKISEDVETVFL